MNISAHDTWQMGMGQTSWLPSDQSLSFVLACVQIITDYCTHMPERSGSTHKRLAKREGLTGHKCDLFFLACRSSKTGMQTCQRN